MNGAAPVWPELGMGAKGLVSVIAPCRNECDYVLDFCRSVTQQRLPEGVTLEVLIADGCSDDGTRELLDEWCARDPRFIVVENPQRIVSAGLNRCIERSSGDVIVRLDIHSHYAVDYVAQCLSALERTGADNVGGAWRAQGRDGMQRAVAAAFQSRWVAGGARSRDVSFEGEVDTVYLGCWPRTTLMQVGGFDDQLVRNQDDEHNQRIRRQGGRIWQSCAIVSTYFPRARLGQVFRQYAQYGYWKPFVMRKHGQPAALRHLVPALFVAALFTGLVLAVAVSVWPLAGLLLAYSGFLCGTLVSMPAVGPGSMAVRIVAVIGAYHLGYGWGSLHGWWDVLWGRSPGERWGALTR